MRKTIKSKHTIMILIILMLCCLGILIGIQISYMSLMKGQADQSSDLKGKKYKYYCAYISEGYDDPFWNSIYDGAKEEGVKQDTYVENFGKKLSLHYTVNDKIKMAIAASVDSIIIEGNNDVSTTDLINQAIDRGIVVVTVYKDQVQSKRRSFIGVNKFEIGYNLCSQAYNSLTKDNDEIMVLYDRNSEASTENIILNSGIKKYLDTYGSKAILNTQIIDSSETYNTEEQIRELLRNASTRPRVLICTNLIQTQCAYQTVVDLNCVGDVKIIGFYETQSILEAIDKGVIDGTLMVDTYQMGIKAVDSVTEFLKAGYVSDYVAVDTHIIDKAEAKKLLVQTGKEQISTQEP
jgi:ribose transport system substrate-binding protein